MESAKITFLSWDTNNLFTREIEKSYGYRLLSFYRFPKSIIMKYIRELWFKLGFPGIELWYNPELKKIDGTIIVFEAMAHEKFIQWLGHNFSGDRKIFWYLNICRGRIQPDTVRECGFEAWTFDRDESKKFHMRYNPLYYIPSWYDQLDLAASKKYDLCFIGRDKGRREEIVALRQRFEKFRLTWFVYITANKVYQRWNHKEYRPVISIEEFYKKQIQARAILELPQKGQVSQTLRPLDALFCHQKLITDNVEVIHEKFYHPQNVFVLGIDPDSQIMDFLNSPFVEMPEALEYYSFKKRLEAFEIT